VLERSQEESLAAFDKVQRRLEFQENVTDDMFQSLQSVNIFMKIVFFTINMYKQNYRLIQV